MFAAMMARVFAGGLGDRGLPATEISSGPLEPETVTSNQHNARLLLGGALLREHNELDCLRADIVAQTRVDASLRSATAVVL